YTDTLNGCIKLVAKRENNILSIHVIDNGIGISAEDIPYVFDKFYRAEKSRSSNISGSGLGLSICKYIINQHGGEIYCHSKKSGGSEFWFTLDSI
ncbi:sensor histidine kinase, partial [Anaerosporobacter sp.]|uniref:sensor histidine kinase n=1 Tax=Anaerosporobacter sp. TaxID=1872529 RepID=UPI00286F8186